MNARRVDDPKRGQLLGGIGLCVLAVIGLCVGMPLFAVGCASVGGAVAIADALIP